MYSVCVYIYTYIYIYNVYIYIYIMYIYNMCTSNYIYIYIGLLWKEPTSAAGPELEAACKALGGHRGISLGVFGAFLASPGGGYCG